MTELTYVRLKKLRACKSALDRFQHFFGDSVDVTEALCLSYSQDRDFNFDWAAKNLLSALDRAKYRRARASAHVEYSRIENMALAKYERATASDLADYISAVDAVTYPQRVKLSARVDYKRATALACAEYDRVMDAARADYERVKASAFGRLFDDKEIRADERRKVLTGNCPECGLPVIQDCWGASACRCIDDREPNWLAEQIRQDQGRGR